MLKKKKCKASKGKQKQQQQQPPIVAPIDRISLLVAPDDIPTLYHTMKSIVAKLEPYMDQSGVSNNTNNGLMSNVSSVLVDTTGLDSTLLKYDNSEDDVDNGDNASASGLDLNILVTSKAKQDRNCNDSTNDIDLNQYIPFENTKPLIKEQVSQPKDSITVDDIQKRAVVSQVKLHNGTIDKPIATIKKECNGCIIDTNQVFDSNTGLNNLLYEYDVEAFAYQEYGVNQISTASTSTMECDDQFDNVAIVNDNKHCHPAPPQRDDYLATILEEYSPFYNFPIDEEISEVERTCHNPYKIVFAGQF